MPNVRIKLLDERVIFWMHTTVLFAKFTFPWTHHFLMWRVTERYVSAVEIYMKTKAGWFCRKDTTQQCLSLL